MVRPFPAILDGVRPRDAIDLMAWPCFSLAKRPRHTPLVHEYRGDFMRVTAPPGSPGLATIWDADILIWAVSQLAEAGNRRLAVRRALTAPAFQVLRFIGRQTGQSQYALLKAGLDRLAGAEVETSVAALGSKSARFRWVEHWEQTDAGLLLVLPEWLFTVVVERRRILRIDPGYFRLTGGTERWIWRLLRRHGQGKSTAWEIPLSALQARSGSLARPSDFIGDMRRIAHRRVLLGYNLALVSERGEERLRIARSADRIHSAGEVPGDRLGDLSTESEPPL
jgi:plasmid replication initiation protein